MALARSRGRQEKTIPSKHRCSHSSRKEKESAVSYTESIRCFKQSIRQADEGDSMAASYLRRNEHQPKQGPVERPVPEGAELARACGKTIALVLATDFGTTPLKVSFEDENEKPVICEDPKNGETKPPALSKIAWGDLKRSASKKGRIGCPSQPIRPCHRSKIIATCPSRRAPGTSQRALYHALQSSGFPKAAMLFGLSRQHRRTCEPP